MIRRRTALAAAVSGVATTQVARAESTPTPDIPYFEGIARLDYVPNGWGVGINRFVLEPGQVWECPYPGPVAVTVDADVLAIENELLARFGMGNNQGGSFGSEKPLGNRIPPRSGVMADDVNLGPLHNKEYEPLVLFITNAVPPPDYTVSESSESAMPSDD